MLPAAAFCQSADLDLSGEERQWLAEHPVIRVHNEMAWAPFNFNTDGEPMGFSIDYMNMLANKIGVEIEYIWGPSWDELLGMLRERDLDVMLNIVQSPQRSEYMLFTDSYVSFALALYTRTGTPQVSSVDDLFGKTIAVPEGFYVEELIAEYPQIQTLTVKNTRDAVLALSAGRADALY